MSGKSVAKTAITAMMVACTVPFAADANDWEPPHFKMLDLIKEVMEVKIDHDSGVIDQKTARLNFTSSTRRNPLTLRPFFRNRTVIYM